MRTLIGALLLMLAVGTAAADDTKLGDLTIAQPWARATPGAAPTGAVYLTIENHGARGDKLVAAASPVADTVMLHTHIVENGVAQMRPVDGIEVAAGATAELKPGGFHIMLMGLHQPLRKSDVFPLTLTFEHAGKVAVQVHVGSVGATGPDN
jgi:hypothetical protein